MKIEPSTFTLSPADSDEARALTNAINGAIEVGQVGRLEGELAEALDNLQYTGRCEVSRDALGVIETALLVFEEEASEATEWADRHEFLVLGSMRRSVSSALKTPDQYGEVLKIVGDAVTAELAQAPVDWSVVAGELVKVYQP